MELSGLSNGCGSWDCEFGIGRPFAWNSLARRLGSVVLAVSLGGVTVAQSAPLVLERDGRVISLEPYAPNILRVTMSTDQGCGDRRSGLRVCGKAVGRGMDARARRGRR